MQVANYSSAVRSSDREIRVLDLLPGEREDAIICTTRVVSLDQHPDFETVSYVWGDRKEERQIEVSGNFISVTKNLYTGLLRLRHSEHLRTLWIDQICINQWDLEEKAAQVALMRNIYKQCSQCVTWMGELTAVGCEIPECDAEAVFAFLRRVAAARTTPLNDLPVLFEQSDRGSAARRAFEGFSMYGNPWWSRIWTVQEAIIPSSGILVWGPLSIPRRDVLTAARNLRDLSNLPSLPQDFAFYRHTYTELLRRLLYPVHGFNHSKTDNALNLLMRWRHREFTDPRDKVYALLGMIEPSAIPNAQSCDYTIATSRLFAQVTLDLINHEGGLRPLLGACEMPQQSVNVPSWAIDFACVNRIGKRQLRWWGHSHRYRVFSACGENSLALPDTPDLHILGLNGIIVDEVSCTVDLLHVNAQDPIDLLELRDPVANCLQLLKKFRASKELPIVYKDGFTWESAFCRTLVGDLIMDELPLDRIARYGRARLEADFGELFDYLQIPLETKLHLDFASDIRPYSPAYRPTSPTLGASSPALNSVTYSPTSPTLPTSCSAYSPTSPVFSRDHCATETWNTEETRTVDTDGDSRDSAADMSKASRITKSVDSSSFDGEYDDRFERTAGRKRSVKHFSSIEDSTLPERKAMEAVTTVADTSSMDHTPNLRRPKPPRKSDASSLSRFSGMSETHWISLPTEQTASLSTEDERRRSKIQRLRGEFLTNEGTSPHNLYRPESGVFANLQESLIGMMENQTFFITRSGYIGIGPPRTRAGDQVWVFNGGNVPFVMRELDKGKGDCPQLALIGDAYVQGIMDGEVMDDVPVVQSIHIQ